MTTTCTCCIDWPRIHEAMGELDRASEGAVVRRQGVVDVFGGTYFSRRYESAGIVGLADLREAIHGLARASWQYIHGASRGAAERIMCATEETSPEWWAVGAPHRDDVRCASHRGAAYRATSYGGDVEVRCIVVRSLSQVREDIREDIRAEVRRTCRIVVAISAAKDALHQAGIGHDPESEICGTGPGYGLTGLGWLRGDRRETAGSVPRTYVEAVARGDVDPLPIGRAAEDDR